MVGVDLRSELGFQILPLLGRELNLTVDVVFEDDLIRIREVHSGTTAKHTTQLNRPPFGHICTLRCHLRLLFVKGPETKCIAPITH